MTALGASERVFALLDEQVNAQYNPNPNLNPNPRCAGSP